MARNIPNTDTLYSVLDFFISNIIIRKDKGKGKDEKVKSYVKVLGKYWGYSIITSRTEGGWVSAVFVMLRCGNNGVSGS